MRTHRSKLTVLLLLLVNFGMSAQLIHSVSLQDGSAVEANHALVKNDTCTFISNEKVDWEFRLLAKKTNFQYITVLESSDTDTFCIPVIREKLSYESSFGVDRDASENDSLEYLVGEVRVTNKDSIVELFPVMLDVLPVRPCVESITWDTITLDPKWDSINEIAHIKIFCRSRGGSAVRLGRLDVAVRNGDYFGGEENIRWNEFETNIDYEQEGEYFTFDYWLDWGRYIRVYVSNEFGGIYSSPALVQDYITDSYVLSVIEKYREELSGIDRNNNDESDISVSVSDNRIDISDDDGDLMAVRLVDSTGRVHLARSETTSIDISNYPAGMYIVVCRTKDNRIVSHKFIKR